jgi:hypothetical protein
MTGQVRKMMHATLEPSIDEIGKAQHDASMPDLTRQQVTDLLAASEAKMDARLANFDTSIKTGFADIRSEFSGVRADFAKMQADVSKGTTDTIKWAIALAISVVIMTVGLLTFINKSADKPAVASPAPIVIYAQPAATAAPPTATPAAQAKQ